MLDRSVLPSLWLQIRGSLLQCHTARQFLSVLHRRSFLYVGNPNPVQKTEGFFQQLQYSHIIFKNLYMYTTKTACTNVFRNRSREAIVKCRNNTGGWTIIYREGYTENANLTSSHPLMSLFYSISSIIICNLNLFCYFANHFVSQANIFIQL